MVQTCTSYEYIHSTMYYGRAGATMYIVHMYMYLVHIWYDVLRTSTLHLCISSVEADTSRALSCVILLHICMYTVALLDYTTRSRTCTQRTRTSMQLSDATCTLLPVQVSIITSIVERRSSRGCAALCAYTSTMYPHSTSYKVRCTCTHIVGLHVARMYYYIVALDYYICTQYYVHRTSTQYDAPCTYVPGTCTMYIIVPWSSI